MAWERRPKGHSGGYYYKSVRTPKGARKVYIGRGEAGHEAAFAVAARKALLLAGRKALLAEREGYALADQLADELNAWSELLLTAVLTASGYHYHRGSWRKARCP